MNLRTVPTHLENVAPLAVWLSCYPFMRSNPAAWLRGYTPTPADVRQFPDLFDGDALRGSTHGTTTTSISSERLVS